MPHTSSARFPGLFCIHFFTETWLDSTVADAVIQIPEFTLHQLDHDFAATSKRKGGGLCYLMNGTWCTNAKMLSHSCTAKLETLAIKCRPFCLPHAISSLVLVAVYIPPDTNAASAIEQLSDIITIT